MKHWRVTFKTKQKQGASPTAEAVSPWRKVGTYPATPTQTTEWLDVWYCLFTDEAEAVAAYLLSLSLEDRHDVILQVASWVKVLPA